jgi:uncharacterized damage-inducible protein DinB
MADSESTLLVALRAEWTHLLIAALDKIEHCQTQLNSEQICLRPGPGLNSIANLLAHIAGNLHQWGVAGFGAEPDCRNRPAEFGDWEPADLKALVQQLLKVLNAVSHVIDSVTSEELLRVRTIQGFSVTGLQALNHTVSHFVGHTHQIVQLTRWQLGGRYQFHWSEASPRTEGVPL